MNPAIRRRCIYRRIALALLAAFLASPLLNSAERVSARTRKNARSFQGKWIWRNYVKKQDQPYAPEGVDVQKEPYALLNVEITQKGDKLIGEYDCAMNFAARTEEGDFTAVVKGDRAEFEIESGHGARVTVRLREERGRLSWRIIKVDWSGGDYFLPKNVWLRRIKPNS